MSKTTTKRWNNNNKTKHAWVVFEHAQKSALYSRILTFKKSQLTMFMLLGMVVFGIFGFLLYANSAIVKIGLRGENERIARDVMNKVPVESYVTSCLEKTTDEAFTKAGQQGGVLYYTQVDDGYLSCVCGCFPFDTPFNFFLGHYYIPYKTGDVIYNVPYGVAYFPYYSGCIIPDFDVEKDPPDYPYIGKLDKEKIIDALGYSPQGGMVGFIALCKSFGTNRKDLSKFLFGQTNQDIKIDNSCKYCYSPEFGHLEKVSMQFYLEKYINDSMVECTDFSVFKDIYGYDIDVDTGNIKTYVTFGDEDTEVLLKYPIKIAVEGQKPITKVLDFSTKPKIRYRQIYLAVKKIVEEETNNPFFELVNDANGENGCRVRIWGDSKDINPKNCLEKGMTIERVEYGQIDKTEWDNLCINYYSGTVNGNDCVTYNADNIEYKNTYNPHYEYTDIIKLTDTKSKINGKDYEFYFAVENRRPALDFIHTTPEGNPYDFIVKEGDTITIDPYAYDPDEDNYDGATNANGRFMDPDKVSYEYVDAVYNANFDERYSWKQGYDEKFNVACFSGTGTVAEKLKNCVDHYEGDDAETGKWTLNADKRTSTIKVDDPIFDKNDPNYKKDLGIHKIRVQVCESATDEGLCDYQDVKIAVIDKPYAEAEGYNKLLLQPNDVWMSVEDPYILDASKSAVLISDETRYNWDYKKTSDGSYNDLYEGENKIFEIPKDITDVGIDITNIKNTVEQRFDVGTFYNFKLTVSSKFSDEWRDSDHAYLNGIEVRQCLPYTKAGTAPYPYHNWPGDSYTTDIIDPFQADHACCDNGNYKPATTSCYNYVEYTCYQNIGGIYPPADMAIKETPAGVAPRGITDLITPDAVPIGADNDIWKRTFSQACSGLRGNICSGETTESWTVAVSCADKTGTEDERCQGPSPYNENNCRNYYSLLPTKCYNYLAGQSFELTFLGESGANGICNENRKCYGSLFCLSQCNGNGGCTTPYDCRCVVGQCVVQCCSASDCTAKPEWSRACVNYNCVYTPQQEPEE